MVTIGKLAQRTRVSAHSIRFYEREGLLAPATKTRAGYRLYTGEALQRIAFIKHAQQCGFSLAEIRALLALRTDERSSCNDVYRVALEKKRQLEARIRSLRAKSRTLGGLIELCARGRRPLEDCRILGRLEKRAAQEPGSVPRGRAMRRQVFPASDET